MHDEDHLAGLKQKRPLQKAAPATNLKSRLGLGHGAALKGEKDEVSAAADAEFIEQVRDVEFYSALGNVEFAGDFLIRKIF